MADKHDKVNEANTPVLDDGGVYWYEILTKHFPYSAFIYR